MSIPDLPGWTTRPPPPFAADMFCRRRSAANYKNCSCIHTGMAHAVAMRRGYHQYCPIAKGAEILAERWTPLIIRNVYLGCHSFTDIVEGCPRISSTLLASRLRSLERDGVIERVAHPTCARLGSPRR